MKKYGRLYSIVLILAFFTLGVLPAQAVTVDLFDWAFNVDGDVYEYTSFDQLGDIPNLDETAFDDGTGIGGLEWTTDVAGDHTFIAFFDHEIDEVINTFFNEYGTVHNVSNLLVGQSWEIDDPWHGNIYNNVTYNILLDGNNDVPIPPQDYDGDGIIDNYDVSMAMGWNFTLFDDQKAKISLLLNDVAPDSGFYLSQTDPVSINQATKGAQGIGAEVPSIYFSSTLEIGGTGQDDDPVIPEPSTIFLMGLGLAGLLGVHRRRASRK